MSQSVIGFFLNTWLVIAVAMFVAIVFAVFRPSARQRMEDNARIPLEEDGGQQ